MRVSREAEVLWHQDRQPSVRRRCALARVGRSGSGSTSSRESSSSGLRTVSVFIDGDLVVIGIIPDWFQVSFAAKFHSSPVPVTPGRLG
jgi:hypothetical protein